MPVENQPIVEPPYHAIILINNSIKDRKQDSKITCLMINDK